MGFVVFQVIAPQSMVYNSKSVFHVKSVIYVQNVIFGQKVAFYHKIWFFVEMKMFMAFGSHKHAKSISRLRRSLATVRGEGGPHHARLPHAGQQPVQGIEMI